MRWILPLLLVAACVPAEEPAVDPIDVTLDPGCAWTLSSTCGLPFPNDRWIEADDSTGTGFRLEHSAYALPKNIDGDEVDPAEYRRLDGFSPAAQILTVFPRPIDLAGLDAPGTFDRSLEADSPTVLVDLDTGERVPHFVEVDVRWHDSTHSSRTDVPVILYVRPAVRLKEGGWYGVALRDLRLEDGSAAPTEPVFAALRDAVPTTSPVVEDARPRFESMFAAFESAGVARADLIQAWSWHTASGGAIRGDLLAMRDDLLDRLTDDAIQCTVTAVEDDVDDLVGRRVHGTFKAPLYMDRDATGANLVRDEAGAPQFSGWADVPFTVSIPRSLLDEDAEPGRLVQFGHGLMGQGSEEIRSGFNRRFSHDYGVVWLATDWQGMTRADLVTVARALADLTDFSSVADRLLQGHVGQMALTRSFLGPCRDLPELAVHGAPPFRPDEAYFVGISQGAILGGTFLTVSPDIDRGALIVGATNFPYIMTRSLNWREYELILKAWYDDRVERELGVSVIGSLWDRAEPNAWLPHLRAGDLPGTHPKEVLYQIARDDLQVQNLMSEVAVRDLGIPLLGPSPKGIWGVDEVDGPVDSAAVYFDLGGQAPPTTNELPEAVNNAHNDQRSLRAAMEQLDAFLRPDGQVIHTCEGPCDPE